MSKGAFQQVYHNFKYSTMKRLDQSHLYSNKPTKSRPEWNPGLSTLEKSTPIEELI